jgi:predicted DNA-binding protein with PD1-like motif
MHSKLIKRDGARTFIVVLDTGEEAFKAITAFANDNNILAASLTAIGAFERATIGWFDFDGKEYVKIPVGNQVEVLSLLGDIAEGDDGKSSLHTHAVLGLRDGSVRGGHLIEGYVRPTLEVTLVESEAHLRRKKKAGLGIALIDLGPTLGPAVE